MPTSSLPFPTSNNAPLPIPGGYGNPTGANFGAFGSTTGQPFPTMPTYGGYGGGSNSIFPGVTGPSSNVGPWGTGQGLQSLSSGLFSTDPNAPNYDKYGTSLIKDLGKIYGKGAGSLLGDILSKGLFNPQVAAAMLNAQQPGIARGEADLLGAFGGAGARFGSPAAIGMGDYLSQVQLNQQNTLAKMYEGSQQEQLALFMNLLQTIHQNRSDTPSLLNALLAGGSTLANITNNTQGGFGTSGTSIPFPGTGNDPFGFSAASSAANNAQWDQLWSDMQNEHIASSAGTVLGGAGGPGGAPPSMFPVMPQ